jgi:hypothetical protein
MSSDIVKMISELMGDGAVATLDSGQDVAIQEVGRGCLHERGKRIRVSNSGNKKQTKTS